MHWQRQGYRVAVKQCGARLVNRQRLRDIVLIKAGCEAVKSWTVSIEKRGDVGDNNLHQWCAATEKSTLAKHL